MKKFYQYKIYDKANVYKTTLDPKKVMSDIGFSQNINGTQGEINIEMDLDFDNSYFLQGDLVKITEYSDLNKAGRQIYYGRVSKIDRIQDQSSQRIVLVCLGIGTLLKKIIFDNGTKTFDLNQDPAETLKDIVDYANTKVWSIFSYGANVVTYWKSINIGFDYTDCFQAIENTAETTDFRWYIDAIGELYFKAKPVTSTHKLTNQYNVEYIDRSENIEDVVNKIYVKRASGEVTSQDATSQTTYWLREKRETKTDLKDAGSAQEYADKYIEKNKDMKPESKVTVNSFYDIVTIKPWDSIEIRNFDFGIDNLQVLKTDYDGDKMQLTLERLYTFGDAVSNV